MIPTMIFLFLSCEISSTKHDSQLSMLNSISSLLLYSHLCEIYKPAPPNAEFVGVCSNSKPGMLREKSELFSVSEFVLGFLDSFRICNLVSVIPIKSKFILLLSIKLVMDSRFFFKLLALKWIADTRLLKLEVYSWKTELKSFLFKT